MNSHLSDLLATLAIQRDGYSALIDSAEKLNRAIQAKNGIEVQTLTRQYDHIMNAIMDTEDKRLQICDLLKTELSISIPHPTITQIAAAINTTERKPLEELRDQLKGFIARLTKINMSNQILLEESLIEINHTMTIFVRSRAKFAGYRHTGCLDQKSVDQNIINRIA